jgi:hypothetical protein
MEKLPPTPQTNALNRNLREACRDEYMYSEMLAFAQMLERERNEMRNAISEAHDVLNWTLQVMPPPFDYAALAKLAALAKPQLVIT